MIGWAESERRTLELVDAVRPDLVHLNSAVLVPSAHALYRKGVQFVWHIREGASHGHLGLRYAFMRYAMLHWPLELIFLSEAERLEWVDGVHGRVIPNFVDFNRFDHSLDGQQIRREYGIEKDAKLVLYLGGLNAVKGIFPLLRALALAKAQEPRLVCFMPGSVYQTSGRWYSKLGRTVLPLVGSGTHAQRIDKTIRRFGLEKTCIQTEFIPHVEKLLAACDLLVFPATTNHFARPIVEAAAMGRAVVASHFPILEELVKHEETGLLVPANQPVPLADAILALLRDPEKRERFGKRGRAIARAKYDAMINTKKIMQIYDNFFASLHHVL
jgi:glycosyltransferase involved in cell wall biosynthesis